MPQSLLDTQSCGHTAILQKDVRQYGATYHKRQDVPDDLPNLFSGLDVTSKSKNRRKSKQKGGAPLKSTSSAVAAGRPQYLKLTLLRVLAPKGPRRPQCLPEEIRVQIFTALFDLAAPPYQTYVIRDDSSSDSVLDARRLPSPDEFPPVCRQGYEAVRQAMLWGLTIQDLAWRDWMFSRLHFVVDKLDQALSSRPKDSRPNMTQRLACTMTSAILPIARLAVRKPRTSVVGREVHEKLWLIAYHADMAYWLQIHANFWSTQDVRAHGSYKFAKSFCDMFLELLDAFERENKSVLLYYLGISQGQLAMESKKLEEGIPRMKQKRRDR